MVIEREWVDRELERGEHVCVLVVGVTSSAASSTGTQSPGTDRSHILLRSNEMNIATVNNSRFWR